MNISSLVNYYEFISGDAEYYALIMATSMYEALKTYDEEVSELDPLGDLHPKELSEVEAVTKISQSPNDEETMIPMGKDKAEFIIEEAKSTIQESWDAWDYNHHLGHVLLIDASLT